jgi:hypothetical protein
MCCENLVCGTCASPVVEARCPTCRATRAQMHHAGFTISPQVLALILALAAVLAVLAVHARLG